MGTLRRSGALALGLALAGCSDDRFALAPGPDSPAKAQDHSSGVVVQVKGTADHLRTVGDVTALTLFVLRQPTEGRWNHYRLLLLPLPGGRVLSGGPGDMYLDRR